MRNMQRKLGVATGVAGVLLSMLAAGTAAAENARPAGNGLEEIPDDELGDMRGRYVVAAIDRYGREVNVVLDARDGQVLAVRPLGRGGFGSPPLGYRGPAPYDPMDGRAPPAAGPMMPPADDDEFFDSDRYNAARAGRAP